MQKKQLFEYAVLRIVPRVEREEFLNAGIILYCRGAQFLQALIRLNTDRLSCLDPDADIEEIIQHLSSLERICQGDPDSGPIGRLPVAERFRWLTATRSTIVQTSKVHPGFTTDAPTTLQKLFEEIVL